MPEAVSIQSEELAKRFAKKFGADNLAALYKEYHYHIEHSEYTHNNHDAEFLVALYSSIYYNCIADSEVGDLDKKKVLQWVYDNVYYGHIAEAVDKPQKEIAILFNPDGQFNEVIADEEDDDEEEEESPSAATKRGFSKFDYLLES
jgi:hypothetical protein